VGYHKAAGGIPAKAPPVPVWTDIEFSDAFGRHGDYHLQRTRSDVQMFPLSVECLLKSAPPIVMRSKSTPRKFVERRFALVMIPLNSAPSKLAPVASVIMMFTRASVAPAKLERMALVLWNVDELKLRH
jgi:hypothetical protein